MKYALVLTLGVLTGLAFSRIPHYVGPIFNDEPGDPEGHTPKERRWDHGVLVLDWPPAPATDHDAFERVTP